MKIPINKANQYRKGELVLLKANWPAIVMEATRGNNPTIINMVEVFGFAHECGSCYTSDVLKRLNGNEFEMFKKMMGFENEKHYFEGALITKPENLIEVQNEQKDNETSRL